MRGHSPTLDYNWKLARCGLGDESMRNTLCAVALAMLSIAFDMTGYAQQPVLQRGYDPGLSGANLTETTLTSSNVTPTTFGLVFNLPVDDRIYAQPLYVPNVVMMQGTHNVVYVATMSDTLYAFDADVGGSPLWSVNFASSVGAVPVAFANFTFAGNTNIVGNLGILSTPVIDPSTHIMYLVACTLEGGTMVYRLHAVDITNGTEPYTNVVISASHGGVTFDAAHQTQRASLALSDGQVVFGFAAVEAETNDEGGYTGWVLAYNEQTLAQSGAFATVTTGGTLGGGVWQSGRPPVVDSAGFVYVFTGNGYTSGYNGVSNFSESVLKLNPANGLALVDWFTPSDWNYLDSADLDLASSGPLLVPGTSPSLLAGGGKAGVLYLLNTSNLQHYNATDQVVQEETIGASSLRGGPVYWQRSAANGGPLLYDWASSDWVKAYAFNGATFASSPTYQGSATFQYPGGILALSANGQQQGTGVLWATVASSGNVYNDATDPGVLYAFDADDVATQLYTSTTNSARDNFGTFAKFVPPLVANGKVYVATFSDKVAVYGLLSQSTPTAATPTFSPAPGSYASAQSVTLSDTTAGAVIYYTTNGTAPTTGSTKYSAAIPVNSTTTIEAIAVASGYTNSAVAVGTYTISAQPVAATPTFSPAPGTYTSAQSVTLSDTTAGAAIYYTTNGTPPTTSSTQYVSGTPLSISATTTIEAIAVASGYTNSAVAVGTYTISASGTTPVSVSLASADNVDGIANAGTPVPGSGLDGGGNAYAGALLGTSLTWAGSTFTFGAAETADAVTRTTITLPVGSYAALNILATGVQGNQVNQTFVVTYSDGTTSTFTQSLSDWFTPQNYAGETAVLQMPYRLYSNGTLDNEPFYLYGYSFALNSAKTVQSLTLPNNRDVVALAVDLTP
jgi:Chitobiase/beta-hexosaminidase C-terminal domain